MSVELGLRRGLSVRRFELVGTIAREQKRAELTPVLVWVQSRQEDAQDLDPEALAAELLGPGAGMVTVARRLLHICCSLSLVEEKAGRLTEEGERAVESGTILRPETGEWTIWACEDPLLEFPIVGIKPGGAHRNHEDRAAARRADQRARPEPMPGWVQWAHGRSAVMLADGAFARFDEISAPAVEVGKEEQLELVWTPGGDPGVHIAGTIGPWTNIDRGVTASDLPSTGDVWRALLESRSLDRCWDAVRTALCVPFEATTDDAERMTMRTALKFDSPTLDGLGEFHDLTVNDIRLRPDGDESASKWARHQLMAQLGGVQTRAVYAALADRVRSAFDGFDIRMPLREELLKELATSDDEGSHSRAYWALNAALDWGL